MVLKKNKTESTFTKNDKILVALLTVVQFTVVLDFAVLAPLGAQLMRELHISAAQFSYVVSAYAISAGISGFILASFADKFDRRKLLIIMYIGFLVGTLLCAVTHTYHFLLIARVVAGVFGGVMSGISFAIVTDVFRFQVRGTVMGFIQMAFSASQVLGIPVGLFLAQHWSWNLPFYLIVALGLINLVLIIKYMKPLTEHLKMNVGLSFMQKCTLLFNNKNHWLAFATTFFMATGGFMLMPFSSPYLVNNVGLKESDLSLIFFAAGIGSFIFSPIFGRLSDVYGKFRIFAIGSSAAAVMIYIYTDLARTPLWLVITIFTLLTIAVGSRMASSAALISAVPAPGQRGAFMNINSSVQQISGGAATLISGAILTQNADGAFTNFHTVGWVTIASLFICIGLMYLINKRVVVGAV